MAVMSRLCVWGFEGADADQLDCTAREANGRRKRYGLTAEPQPS
jgi:hypothetical protein